MSGLDPTRRAGPSGFDVHASALKLALETNRAVPLPCREDSAKHAGPGPFDSGGQMATLDSVQGPVHLPHQAKKDPKQT
jgi:hypothetical protein